MLESVAGTSTQWLPGCENYSAEGLIETGSLSFKSSH